MFINDLNFNSIDFSNSAALAICDFQFWCLPIICLPIINNPNLNSIDFSKSAALAICDWGGTASELCPMQLSGLFQHFFAKSLFQHF